MKFLLRIALIAAFAYLTGAHTSWPWWTMAIGAFLVGFVLGHKPRKIRIKGKVPVHRPLSFWSGFLAVFLLWAAVAWRADHLNEALLSQKMYQLLQLSFVPPELGNYALIAIAATIGGLVAGLASLSGNYLGEVVK